MSVLLFLVVITGAVCGQPVWNESIRTIDAGLSPALAVDPNGGLAIAWVSQTGTSASPPGLYPSHWTSDVYVSFSPDRGQTWTAPALLSEPGLNSIAPDIAAGTAAGEFYVTWASGDAFSGYRQHAARTADYGLSFSSSTRLQTYIEPGQGVLLPDVEVTATGPVVGFAAVNQDLAARPFELNITTLDATAQVWSVPETVAISGPRLSSQHPLTAGVQTLMASGSITSSSMENSAAEIFLVRSSSAGASWSPRIFPAKNPQVYSLTPNLSTDGKGTWVLMYSGSLIPTPTGMRFGKVYCQRSTDDGESWTPPQLIDQSHIFQTDTPIGIATDGNGRWMAQLNSAYSYSSDNGATWTPFSDITGFPSNLKPGSLAYLGNNKWGFLQRQFSPPGIYLRVAEWTPATVAGWAMY